MGLVCFFVLFSWNGYVFNCVVLYEERCVIELFGIRCCCNGLVVVVGMVCDGELF